MAYDASTVVDNEKLKIELSFGYEGTWVLARGRVGYSIFNF